MSEPRLHVLGIGNAIVDVLSHADDAFLTQNRIAKGAMTLIDAERAQQLYAAMGPGIEISGGSAANTVVGVASLGGKAAYTGKVSKDQLGEVFAHDIRAAGVSYSTPPAADGPSTARCLILVTPDAQRSMNTYLGASSYLAPADLDSGLIRESAITFMEGYLFDRPAAREAFFRAAEIAHGAGRQVALTLSDPFCVDRYRSEFRMLVKQGVDILFANEKEIVSLYEVHDFDDALQLVRRDCRMAALTRSEKGSILVTGEEVHVIDAEPVPNVVDTTGAGDLYASGVLYGLARGFDPATCGRLGSLAAAEVISHFGARPETPLKDLAARAGLKV
ncbi:MAG: adenosine kinase [Alphaproteobacteria bacterium]